MTFNFLKPNSLAFRLFAASALWALIALPIAGLLLQSLYRAGVEQGFDQNLEGQLTSLIAATIGDDPKRPTVNSNLSRDLFNVPLSGFYWQIQPVKDKSAPAFVSNSLLDKRLTPPSKQGIKPEDGLVRYADLVGPEEVLLRVAEQQFAFGEGDETIQYSYVVAIKRDDLDQSVSEFRTMLAITLGVLGLGLLGATIAQVLYGLRPLQEIEEGLSRIRSGKATLLEGELPDEIADLQVELNELLKANEDIIERARTHVGNLAHALKTPLSVITNEANEEKNPFGSKVQEQAQIMRDQINHHLDRARAVARSSALGSVTDIDEVSGALSRTLQKIYERDQVTIEVVGDKGLRFKGERQDLEEMLGNLLDNACKWADRNVELRVTAMETGRSRLRPQVEFCITDDGPGLTEEQTRQVLQRGQRLDETKPGSGLGLSIVGELAELYQGAFVLGKAKSGGVAATLRLPSAT